MSAEQKKHVYIRELVTNKEIHRIETSMTGRMLDKMLDGLYQKVDLERFWVDSKEVEE